MANNVWSSAGSTDANVAGNWSLGWVPKAGDTMYLDGTSVVNCTLSAGIACDAISVVAAYTGTLSYGASAFTVATTGNQEYAGAGALLLGDSVITCGGNFRYSSQAGFNAGTSTVNLTGTSKTLVGTNNKYLYDVVISGTYLSNDGYFWFNHSLDIQAGGSLTDSRNIYTVEGVTVNIDGMLSEATGKYILATSPIITVGATGVITGEGMLWIYGAASGRGITQQDGTIDIATLRYYRPKSGSVLVPGVYESLIEIQNSGTSTYYCPIDDAGNYTLTGGVWLNNTNTGTIVWNASAVTGIEIQGDVTVTNSGGGTITYTKGPTLVFAGTVLQTADFDDLAVGDIEIDKFADVLTLSGGAEVDSLTLTDGTLDINGQTLTDGGNFTMAAGTAVQDTAATGSIQIAGSLDINGADGNECTWTDADLDVGVAGDADWCTVTNSTNSGTEIDATFNCTDGTGNTGWDFGGAPAFAGSNLILGGGVL